MEGKTFKKSTLTFAEGFMGKEAQLASEQGKPIMTFDWDRAAEIIKQFKSKERFIAEAGLQGDWKFTSGTIYTENNICNSRHTYLSSNWAVPTLILSWEGKEQKEIPCYTTAEGTRFNADSKWDKLSIAILEGEDKI